MDQVLQEADLLPTLQAGIHINGRIIDTKDEARRTYWEKDRFAGFIFYTLFQETAEMKRCFRRSKGGKQR